MITHDAIFTNVATTADNQPWWEGKKTTGEPAIDWQGRPLRPRQRSRGPSELALHGRGDEQPVLLGAGRRARGRADLGDRVRRPPQNVAPLVYEAKDWKHGVLVGASVASETTAAMVGEVGVVRRDPMAMKPFCGYNFGDYWAHWLSFPERSDNLPKIFHVNWFRQDEDGKFLWPGFGENLRVLRWIIDRCEDRVRTPARRRSATCRIEPSISTPRGLEISDCARARG